MKTGSKYVGWVFAAAIAVSAAAAGAPAVTSADFSAAALEILAPSTPIVTTWPWPVSGVPCAPRTAARVGHAVRRDSWSPARSGGAIVAGDHFTSHVPCDSTRCKTDLIVMVPRPASVRRSVTGALAACWPACMAPAVKLAWRTVRSRNAAWFTDVKSAGGLLVSFCIAAQSCLAQAAR